MNNKAWTKAAWTSGILAPVLVLIWLGGCALGPASVLDPKRPKVDAVPGKIKQESSALSKTQREVRENVEQTPPRRVEVEPILPAYDPLKNKIVSFSMVDEDMRTVLFVLAQAVGMNLIIDPSITAEGRQITLHFEKVPASIVLKHILKTFDLSYEIEGTVIAVKPFEERLFALNFMDANVKSTFDLGGDVFGAGGGQNRESITGLSGSFKLTGESSKEISPYDGLEKMIKPLISGQGKYAFNRMAGTLFVKDTPASVQAVEKMIANCKDVISRQIRIEAQIIEVTLSDENSYGIDWNALKNNPVLDDVSSAAWSVGTGLVLSGTHGNYTLGAVINALNRFGDTKVVSNPILRCKHGKPAIISVGTSFTYKKSVKTTTTVGTTATTERQSTEVEVSTVFDGLILGVLPFIEPNKKITLLINPIKSEVDQASLIPQPIGTEATESISLPKLQIKEMNTTISLDNGDAVVLGGLIDRRTVVDNRGIPILSAIPVLGYLFKNEYKREESRELVLILFVSLV
ncbi:MAG: hypothetical protein AB1641_14245 [Thermodesulfobacteriota bacterium]